MRLHSFPTRRSSDLKDKALQGFEIRGAVLDGELLEAAQAIDVSKWPTREEQIAIVLGQILGVGAKLSGQFIAFGGKLASQIEKIAEGNSATGTGHDGGN
jgi:large subunit ribosomal protein L10